MGVIGLKQGQAEMPPSRAVSLSWQLAWHGVHAPASVCGQPAVKPRMGHRGSAQVFQQNDMCTVDTSVDVAGCVQRVAWQ